MSNRDYSLIPPAIREALDDWAKTGRKRGDFVMSVLRNDLAGACGRADEDSAAALVAIVAYVYNCLPSLCWGSAAAVAAWPGLLERACATATLKGESA
jgi:hypothetical protein